MTLAHLLQRQARVAPDRPAIFEGSRAWATHAQWAARSAGLAHRLGDAGLQPGDRVLLFMRNHPRYLEILWGAWWAGLVVVPVNAKLHPAEAEWIIDDAQARWAFVTRVSRRRRWRVWSGRSTSSRSRPTRCSRRPAAVRRSPSAR